MVLKMSLETFSCLFIVLLSLIGKGYSECLTIAGPGKGRPCIFPFKFQELEYSECTTYQADDKRPWCATKVNENGEHISNTYGICGEDCRGFKPRENISCKTIEGQDCIIPFHINQMPYLGCVRNKITDTVYRCPIKQSTKTQRVGFETIDELEGICSNDCPKGDELLATTHLTIQEIFKSLKKYGIAHTAVPEGVRCNDYLQKQYEQEVLHGPATIKELHKIFCKSLCTYDKKTCEKYASYRITKRMNKPLGDGGVSLQDCQLQCVRDDDIAAMLKRIQHSKIQDLVRPENWNENYTLTDNRNKAYAVHIHQ